MQSNWSSIPGLLSVLSVPSGHWGALCNHEHFRAFPDLWPCNRRGLSWSFHSLTYVCNFLTRRLSLSIKCMCKCDPLCDSFPVYNCQVFCIITCCSRPVDGASSWRRHWGKRVASPEVFILLFVNYECWKYVHKERILTFVLCYVINCSLIIETG